MPHTVELKYDIPQGNMLDPLINLLYVKDMPDQIEFGKMFMHAYDTALVVPLKQIQEAGKKYRMIF